MNFDLIIIGNELLNGKIQDKNTFFMAKNLYQQGHHLRKVHLIGDNYQDFSKALIEAQQSVQVVITTGGLGPTKDDLTKEMLASFFNKKITFNEQAYQQTLSHYKRHDRKYNKDKIDYHNLPLEFKALPNSIGYAPGISYTVDAKYIFALPGVPVEFQEMLTQAVLPQLKKYKSEKIKHIIIKTWKTSEANIFHKIAPTLWEQLETFGEVSSLPHLLSVDIGIKLVGSDLEVQQNEEKLVRLIKSSKLNDYIWHIGPESLEEIIIQKANEKKLSFGFAESCTGGLCASRITNTSGSSSVFWGGIISYANSVKVNSLGVMPNTLNSFGAVSAETALEMANGAKEKLQVDIAISTTGIAGPGGGSQEKPVGTIGIGFSDKHANSSEVLNFKGNRELLKEVFSQAALLKLLERILNY